MHGVVRGSLAPRPGGADGLRAASPPVLGIDLGTSTSTAAAVVGGRVRFAVDERGEAAIPSVIYLPERGAPVVGVEAERMRAVDPAHTIWGLKRMLGRARDSGPVRILEASSAAKLRGQPGQPVSVWARGREWSPPELSAILIRHLVDRAEARFGVRSTRCVLTVPVAAPKSARDATVQAARIAGLEVVRLAVEPAAAAVGAGLHTFRGERRFLIFDFGGGTFDVTVMSQRDDQLQVLAAGGDDMLGGDDLDLALAKIVSSWVWLHARVDLPKDVARWSRVERHAERVKRALSSAAETRFRLDDAYAIAGRPQDLDLRLRRDDVEPHWAEFVQRALRVSAEAMVEAQTRPNALAGVVMVGGTCFVPLVRREVARVLGAELGAELDPQTSVAEGAALLGTPQARLEAA